MSRAREVFNSITLSGTVVTHPLLAHHDTGAYAIFTIRHDLTAPRPFEVDVSVTGPAAEDLVSYGLSKGDRVVATGAYAELLTLPTIRAAYVRVLPQDDVHGPVFQTRRTHHQDATEEVAQ